PRERSPPRATRSPWWTRTWARSMRPERRRGPWWLMPTRWPTRPRLTAFAYCLPQDPYPQQRDRTTLLPDNTLPPRVWRPVRPPGVVLTADQLVATWRSQRAGKRLAVTVEPFAPLATPTRAT